MDPEDAEREFGGQALTETSEEAATECEAELEPEATEAINQSVATEQTGATISPMIQPLQLTATSPTVPAPTATTEPVATEPTADDPTPVTNLTSGQPGQATTPAFQASGNPFPVVLAKDSPQTNGRPDNRCLRPFVQPMSRDAVKTPQQQ